MILSQTRWARCLARWWKLTPSRRRAGRALSLCIEALEVRITPSSFGFGYALGLGTVGNDIGNAVAADSAGNVTVVGNFQTPGSIDLDPGPASYTFTDTKTSLIDGFAASYNPDGTLRWGAHFASPSGNGAFDVAIDAQGNVFISGSVGHLGEPMQILPHAGTPITLSSNGLETFLAKFSPGGDLLWARTMGEAGTNRFAYDLATDSAGNVYATGNLKNGTESIHQAFIAKYDGASGATIWSQLIQDGTGISPPYRNYTTYAGGSGIAVDASGNVWTTGPYLGTIDFNPDPAQANWLTYSGASTNSIYGDVYVLKLDFAGNYLWAGSVGGRNFETAAAIVADGTGNVYLAGHYDADAQNDFDPGPDALTLPGSGGYLLKIDANGSLLWAHGGLAGITALDIDAAANVYLAGPFTGTIDADPGPGTFHLTSAGSNDILISKLDSDGRFLWATSMGGPASDSGTGIALDGDGNIYTTGFFRETVDFDPGAGTFNLSSTPNASGTTTTDVFVSKLVPAAPPPGLSISDASVTEGHSGTVMATFTVTRTGDTTQEATVEYSTANGSATAGSDYTPVSGTLTFAPYETTKTVSVPINGDRLGELNETFLVNLSNPAGAAIVDGQGVGTIVDDEPRISIDDVIMAEGRKGQKTLFTFTVTLSAAYDQPVTLSFQTVNGTARTSNNDYIAKSGTLTFAPGETTKTITIEVKGDSKKEADEYFYLDLFGLGSNALFTRNRGIGTILNDD